MLYLFQSREIGSFILLKIIKNEGAFNYGAMEEFGLRDNHFEEDGQIISREAIKASIDSGEAYRIVVDGNKVGGVVIKVDGDKGDLVEFCHKTNGDLRQTEHLFFSWGCGILCV